MVEISDNEVQLAIRVAKEGGNIAESVKKTTKEYRKENDSIVTDADRKAEEIIRGQLTENSEYAILGEEQGKNKIDSDTYWVVDPIDGTRNFSYEQPMYCTGVALVRDGSPEIGVCYAPEIELLFYAKAGCGAYLNDGGLNDERIRISGEDELSESYIGFSGYKCTKYVHDLLNVTTDLQNIRSAILTECWVAAGWNDVGMITAMAPWDMAVGVVMVREAGGVMKSIVDGKTSWESIQDGRVALGSEGLVDELVDCFSDEVVLEMSEDEYP